MDRRHVSIIPERHVPCAFSHTCCSTWQRTCFPVHAAVQMLVPYAWKSHFSRVKSHSRKLKQQNYQPYGTCHTVSYTVTVVIWYDFPSIWQWLCMWLSFMIKSGMLPCATQLCVCAVSILTRWLKGKFPTSSIQWIIRLWRSSYHFTQWYLSSLPALLSLCMWPAIVLQICRLCST